MTKKLSWRLSKLPSVEELRELVKDKIITQEEAREVLFNFETDEERDSKSLKEEIKFLRETVEKLSENKTSRITEIIREIQPIYRGYGWYQPYYNWCNATYTTTDNLLTGVNTVANYSLQSAVSSIASDQQAAFTAINTF